MPLQGTVAFNSKANANKDLVLRIDMSSYVPKLYSFEQNLDNAIDRFKQTYSRYLSFPPKETGSAILHFRDLLQVVEQSEYSVCILLEHY